MLANPFPRGSCGLTVGAGLLAPGQPHRAFPDHRGPVACALTRQRRHPRSQWRVRAGFTPASLHDRRLFFSGPSLPERPTHRCARGPRPRRASNGSLPVGSGSGFSISLSRVVEVVGAAPRERRVQLSVLDEPGRERHRPRTSRARPPRPIRCRTDGLHLPPVGQHRKEVRHGLYGSSAPSMFAATALPWLNATSQCSSLTRRAAVKHGLVFADVPCRVDPGHGALETGIAPDTAAVPDLQSRAASQCYVGRDAGADHDCLRRPARGPAGVTTRATRPSPSKRSRLIVAVDRYAVGFEQVLDEAYPRARRSSLPR